MGFLVHMLPYCLQLKQTQMHICFISNAPAPLQAMGKEIQGVMGAAAEKAGV